MRLGSFMKVTTSPKVSFPQLQLLSLELSHWKSQTLSRSRAARQQPGDLLKRLLQGLFPQTACPPQSPLYQHVHLCSCALLGCDAPGTLTPTFDQPCQPSLPHHSAPMPLTCSPHSCKVHRTACSRAQQTKTSPSFQNT